MIIYKIVFFKFLEILKDWELEIIGYKDDQDRYILGKKYFYENVRETVM